jgi:hypothetical protein
VYSAILLLSFGALGLSLAGQRSADVTLLRGLGAPFTVLPSGEVSNQIRLKIANRTDGERSYAIELVGGEGLTLIAPENPLTVAAGDSALTAAFITAPRASFTGGERSVVIRVSDGVDFEERFEHRLLGPEPSAGGAP